MEKQILKKAYDKQFEIYSKETEKANSLLSVGASKRSESISADRLASLTAVCLAILNLDESMTRE